MRLEDSLGPWLSLRPVIFVTLCGGSVFVGSERGQPLGCNEFVAATNKFGNFVPVDFAGVQAPCDLAFAGQIGRPIESAGLHGGEGIVVAGPPWSRRPPPQNLQVEFHIQRARHGIWTIGRDFPEPHHTIHGDCVLHHGFDGIETHAAIAHLARLGNQMLGQRSSQAFPSKLGTEVEPLHFANAGFDLVERDATGELTFIFRQQQTSFRKHVVAG